MTGIRFGTDGWRAVMNDEFILANVRRVAWAIADHILVGQGAGAEIVIAHDTRFFAEEFAQACARVCVARGLAVRMAGRPLPTPLAAFAVKHYQTAGAIMLTASHNPAIYGGMKFIPDYAGPATPEITASIEARIAEAPEDIPVAFGEFLMGECEPYDPYKEHVAGLLDLESIADARPSVLVDPMHGAGQGVLSSLLTQFGCEVREMHSGRDVMFGGILPDPSKENLAFLARAVRHGGYSLGLGLDGDADRFGVIDSEGEYLAANDLVSLFAVHLARNRGRQGAIVRTVATTHRLDSIARIMGLELKETPVGFKYIAQTMLAEPVLIGGEESGGVSIGGHIPEKDGVLANLLAVEVYSAGGGLPLSRMLQALEEETGPRVFRRMDLHVPEDRKAGMIDSLKDEPPERVGPWAVTDVRTVDGVKLVMEGDRWLLARPSGTEPLLRVYLEAESPEGLSELAAFAEERFS